GGQRQITRQQSRSPEQEGTEREQALAARLLSSSTRPSSSRPIRSVGVMALRHLVTRVGFPALRRASATRFSPAAGSRPLSYRSYKGKEQTQILQDIGDMMRRSKYLSEDDRRLLKILDEKRNKEIQRCREEWDSFEKLLRRDMQDLAGFTKKVVKIGDVTAAVGLGAFALAVGARCLL
ncbi:unnamed protein product, partial [Urochloa humidicola]